MEENEYSDLLNYLSRKTYPRGYSDNQKKTLRRKAKNYEFISGELYYYLRNAAIPHKVLLSKERRLESIATAHHDEPTGRHHGIQKTTTRLLNELHCYWRGFTKDIRIFVKDCTICKSGGETTGVHCENNFVQYSNITPATNNPGKADSQDSSPQGYSNKTEQSTLPGLQCRECHLHFTSKISFRIHQRKHAEGPAQLLSTQTPEAVTCVESYDEKETSSENTPPATQSYSNMGSMTFKEEGLTPIMGENQEPIPFANANPVFPVPEQNYTHKEVLAPAKGKFDFSDSNRGDMWLRTADETLKRIKEENPNVAQWWSHHHPDPLLRHEQWKNSNHPPPPGPFCTPGESHYVPASECNRTVNGNLSHLPDGSRARLPEDDSCMVTSVSAPPVVPGSYQMMPTANKSTCECPNCKEGAHPTTGDNNITPAKAKVHSCHICTKVFRKTWHLKAHVRTHTGERPFACQWPNCGKRFTRSDKLHRHMGMHTGERRFACFVCSKRFVRNDTLTQHLKTHNIYTNSASLQTNSGQPLDVSQANCGVTNPGDPSALSKMPSPCKLKLYNCTYPDCQRVFKKTWHLKAHMCTHTGEKPFVCTWPFCGKRFTRSDKLHRHMGSHTNGKQFYCPICNKHLAHSDYITHHLQVHDGKDVKPPIGFNAVMYENTQGSSFVVSNLTSTINNGSNSNAMYSQQQNMNEPVDIKPTIASILDASLSQVQVGHTKIRIHKPSGKTYDCQMEGCNKVFKKSWHLKAHVRTHTGERPFACQWPLCGKRFARSDKLYRHMTLHTEGKRFPCTLCSKRFVRKDNLKQHMKTHFKKTLKKTAKEDKNPLQLVSLVPPPSLHSFYPT